MAKSKSTAAVLLIAAAISSLTGPAAANVNIGVFARVATVCRVDIVGNYDYALEAGENALGQMTELCNNVDGYQLILNHPVGMQDAWIVIDRQRVPLSANGRTVIVDSDAPTFRQRDIGIVLASDVEGLPLSLQAQPKGMVF